MIHRNARRGAPEKNARRPNARHLLANNNLGRISMNTRARQPIDISVTGSLAAATRRVPVLLLAAIFAWPAATLAQGSNAASRFQQYESQQAFVPAVVPLGVNGGGRVKVVVVMAADSVAAARARVPDRALTSDEKRAVEDQVSAEHEGIEPEISGRGGRVLKRFRHALNGIKIEIDRNEVAALAALPGVVAVLPVLKHRPNNAVSVPFIGAPVVWQGTPRLRGEGVKIAIIDTGIDYTHANFGGPGTVAAFQAAAAASTKPADPALFGPNAPKVKGGTDLVGDAYNANAVDAKGNPDPARTTPQPDPNPLDCNGHGSHVAGTAAGFGVDAHGATYAGPYDSAAFQQAFKIGPGVAPKADIYSVRVFGCNGSTDVVTDAIDWAVQNDMDVINMSLGSDFGTGKTSDALASQNAARAGIIVVASAGNAGPAPYITGTPASGNGVISVAAVDSTASFPAAVMALAGGKSITAIDANGAPLSGSALSVFVLRNSNGGVSLGCDEKEYVNASIAGKLVVTLRGTCARVDGLAPCGRCGGARAPGESRMGPARAERSRSADCGPGATQQLCAAYRGRTGAARWRHAHPGRGVCRGRRRRQRRSREGRPRERQSRGPRPRQPLLRIRRAAPRFQFEPRIESPQSRQNADRIQGHGDAGGRRTAHRQLQPHDDLPRTEGRRVRGREAQGAGRFGRKHSRRPRQHRLPRGRGGRDAYADRCLDERRREPARALLPGAARALQSLVRLCRQIGRSVATQLQCEADELRRRNCRQCRLLRLGLERKTAGSRVLRSPRRRRADDSDLADEQHSRVRGQYVRALLQCRGGRVRHPDRRGWQGWSRFPPRRLRPRRDHRRGLQRPARFRACQPQDRGGAHPVPRRCADRRIDGAAAGARIGSRHHAGDSAPHLLRAGIQSARWKLGGAAGHGVF